MNPGEDTLIAHGQKIENPINRNQRIRDMSLEREKLIKDFQKWLDTNPNKNIIASECASIAERHAQQRVNEVLDKVAWVISGDVYEKSEVIEEILKLKSTINTPNR